MGFTINEIFETPSESVKPRLHHHQSALVLTGVGLFTGNDEDILDLEANVTFDRTTATISCWDSESSEPISETSLTMTTDQARKAVKSRPPEYPAHTMALYLKKPIVLEPGINYEIEHNLQACPYMMLQYLMSSLLLVNFDL